MPATYAHWNFGNRCIAAMPENLQKIIHENREIYDIGVHGPDIFFYDLAHSDVPRYGTSLHDIPASVFFAECKKQINEGNEKIEMLAYVLGYLSHFVLDSALHSYVERKKEVSKITHNLIESQWERHLMILDNREPNLVDRTESLKPDKKKAEIIARFYNAKPKDVLRTTRHQKTIVKALNCISPIKEKVLKKILNTIKLNDYVDLFVGFSEDERCKDSNLRLDKLADKAIIIYKKQLVNLLDYLNDKGKLNDYFDNDLAARPDYKDIEILPYESELAYKVK